MPEPVTRPATSPIDRLRPLDRDLLGLEPHPEDPSALVLEVVPHLCRTDARFYGGAALAAALAAAEAVTGRTALWASAQLVASADLGEHIRVDVDVVASGRTIDQVQARGTVGERLVFSSVGATASPTEGGLGGRGQVMPRVPPPEGCEPWRHAGRPDEPVESLPIGHQLVTDHLAAPLLTEPSGRPGHFAIWARLSSDITHGSTATSPALLAFLADMVPIAISQATGVQGAGTSLDNSLRIGEPLDTEWVLLELDADVAVGGLGHGHVRLWSPDGHLLGVGTQTAKLFSLDDFIRRRRG